MSTGDCLGVVATVRWKDADYTLSAPSPAVFAKLEQWVAASVFAGAKESEAFDPGAVAEVRKNLAARWHRVGGPYWDAVMGTPDGSALQLWGMIAVNRDGFTLDDARQMSLDVPDQVDLALLLAAPDFFTAAAGRANVPPDRIAERRDRVAAESTRQLTRRPSPSPSATTPS